MYYFKLHPNKREFEKDSKTVFMVSEMEDGNYKVLADIGDNIIEDIYTPQDLLSNILSNYWELILTEIKQ